MESTIETARLLLRPMQLADVDPILSIFADPKVMAAFGEPPFDREQMVVWVKRNLTHQAEHGFGLFSVVLKSNATLIGDCGLEIIDVEGERTAELGYDLRSDYWNQGFATEAAQAVRDYAFQTLHLPRLISLIRVGNNASRRVAEKIGMRLLSEFMRYGRSYWRYGLETEA